MEVNFYATLRTVVGGKTIWVDIPSQGTVREAIQAATRLRPALAEHIWRTPDHIYDHIRVFVNGRDATLLPQGMDTPLNPGDKLDIFPPVGGG